MIHATAGHDMAALEMERLGDALLPNGTGAPGAPGAPGALANFLPKIWMVLWNFYGISMEYQWNIYSMECL